MDSFRVSSEDWLAVGKERVGAGGAGAVGTTELCVVVVPGVVAAVVGSTPAPGVNVLTPVVGGPEAPMPTLS
jgi:hypothetical protein